MSTLVQRQLEAGLHVRSFLGQPWYSRTKSCTQRMVEHVALNKPGLEEGPLGEELVFSGSETS